VILYELLTGTRPFTGPTQQDTVRRILSREMTPLPATLPEPLVKAIDRCLRGAPPERWASIGELADALAPYAGAAAAGYAPRIHRLLETPRTSDPGLEDDGADAAPTMVGDMLALSRKYEDSSNVKAATPARAMPRLDDGHSSARSFPWLSVDKIRADAASKEATDASMRRLALIAILLGMLLLGVIGVLLIVSRPVERSAAREAAVTAPPLAPAPAPLPPPRSEAPATATTTAAMPVPSPSATEAVEQGSRPKEQPGPRPTKSNARSTSSRPEGDDPWGWER